MATHSMPFFVKKKDKTEEKTLYSKNLTKLII